eukprot:11173462-Lingulodinium_polyedra.AAC.1
MLKHAPARDSPSGRETTGDKTRPSKSRTHARKRAVDDQAGWSVGCAIRAWAMSVANQQTPGLARNVHEPLTPKTPRANK